MHLFRPFAAPVIGVWFLCSVCFSDEGTPTRAPEFALVDCYGKRHELSDYRDKIVVLEWTNPHCPYVIQHYHTETMKKLATRYGKQGVIWLAIHSSATVTAREMKEWRAEHDLPYPILLDSSGRVGRAYQAKSTPHIFIIRDGAIVYQGAIDNSHADDRRTPRNYVAEALDEILAGRTVTVARTEPYGCPVRYGRKMTRR